MAGSFTDPKMEPGNMLLTRFGLLIRVTKPVNPNLFRLFEHNTIVIDI